MLFLGNTGQLIEKDDVECRGGYLVKKLNLSASGKLSQLIDLDF